MENKTRAYRRAFLRTFGLPVLAMLAILGSALPGVAPADAQPTAANASRTTAIAAMSTVTIPHNYEPRDYQVPLLAAFDSGYKRGIQVWHRRAGKEKTALNLTIKKMAERPGTYYYAFPELKQGRKVIWDGADKEGLRFLDHFPLELMVGEPNNTEMKWRMRCPGAPGKTSLFQVIGSDSFDAALGSNPVGMVFSEYALQDPACWGYFRPMMAENDGWALFNFTPRGENHAYDLWELAKADPKNWFTSLLTVEDTKAIRPEVLEQERREIQRLYGNDALYFQEYFCDFSVPISGAYYAEQIARAYREGRVGSVPHDERLKVDTWWDLGMNDRMSIWMVQVIGAQVRVIDYMEGTGRGLPWYFEQLKRKPYVFGTNVGPHDIEVRELGTGKSRAEVADSLGFPFEVAPNIARIDGIDAVRSMLGRCWFDKDKCQAGINALKSYRKQYDEKRKTYLPTPLHDWASNASDAFRMGAVWLDPDAQTRASNDGNMDRYARAEERRRHGDEGTAILG